MRFTEEMTDKINNTTHDKKKANPWGRCVGLGVHLWGDTLNTSVFVDGRKVCDLEELSRMIEELTMVRESIEEETGVII